MSSSLELYLRPYSLPPHDIPLAKATNSYPISRFYVYCELYTIIPSEASVLKGKFPYNCWTWEPYNLRAHPPSMPLNYHSSSHDDSSKDNVCSRHLCYFEEKDIASKIYFSPSSIFCSLVYYSSLFICFSFIYPPPYLFSSTFPSCHNFFLGLMRSYFKLICLIPGQ